MGPPLTPRQAQVLDGMERGLTNKQIAAELGITASTVRNHAHGIYRRLGVTNRGQAAELGRLNRNGYLAALDQSLRSLTATLERRASTEGLTPAQRELVHAFDRMLAGFPAAEGDYRRAVDAVIDQAGVKPSGRARADDALARLMADLLDH